MSVTVEGIVRNGKIVVAEEFVPPEATRVFVVLPDSLSASRRILSPRFAKPEDARQFVKIIEEDIEDEV